ncbi:AAA family ATPase [bacterium]|nr:AAA family ATPase [bacterium]|tara:strand:+ start:13683 stop:15731 length:2049 start_codon:yes stop_codon:yes gene_type:complete
MSIDLVIEDIGVKDANKGFARISEKKMQQLGLEPYDIVEICGQRKSAIRIMPMKNDDASKDNYIKIDGLTRQNIKSSIKEKVIIKKAELLTTNKIVLSPSNPNSLLFMNDTKILLTQLNGFVVTAGDKLHLKLPGNKSEEFNVISTNPSSPSVIDKKTKIDIKRQNRNSEERKVTTYSDIGGLQEQLKKIKDLVELPLKHPEIFSRLGIDPPKGLLLVGPPGTGKTLLARAIAQECGVNFILVNGPEIVRKFYGESEALLREIFQNASDKQPSILFIDEIDAVAPKRDRVHGEVEKRIVGQLLALMDGLKDRGKVIVLAATNMPNSIDPALRRPGRFDKEIVLDAPNIMARKEILEIHTRGMPLDENVNLEEISNITSGFVGADLEMLCKDAALISVQKLTDKESVNYDLLDSIKVSNANFIEAVNGIEPSAIREIFVETPKVKWDEIGGLEDLKDILQMVVINPIKNNEFREKMPKGIMLYGPPGSGKTMLAKALANLSGMNFISIKGPELVSKYLGESEEKLKDFFNKARQVSPSILFIDEIDTICLEESSYNSNTHRLTSQLLLEMDGFKDLNNVVVLAATNKIEQIDKSLLRSGRFDLVLETRTPNIKELISIFNIKRDTKGLEIDLTKKQLESLLKDFNGADIDTMFNLAVQFSNTIKLDYESLTRAANEIEKRKNL